LLARKKFYMAARADVIGVFIPKTILNITEIGSVVM